MNRATLTLLFGIGLLLASLANGSVSYLKRVGVLDRPFHENFMAEHCNLSGFAPDSVGTRCMCMRDPTARPVAKPGYVYENNTVYERGVKLIKDALFGLFVLVSIYLVRSRPTTAPSAATSWPVNALAADVAIGFAVAASLWGIAFAVMGLRAFAFLPVAMLGGWTVAGLPRVAQCMGWLMALQALLVIVEFLFGIPLRTCPFSFRVAGSLILPNSLGVFVVVALAFYADFSKGRALFLLLLVTAVGLLLASGSGAGMVTLFVWGAAFLLQRLKGTARWMLVATTALLGVALAVALPSITQRPDIYDSLFAPGGRVEKLQNVVQASSTTAILVGRGIGFGTNTNASIAAVSSASVPTVMGPEVPFYADSTVTMLFTQLGLVGIGFFYWLLGWAFWRDRTARLTYLVIGLASLTMNIMELFPVNFLLGLALAHTLSVARQPQSLAEPN